MSDHEFDMSLKQRAKAERDPVPAGLEARLRTAMEGLTEEQAGVKRTRSRVLRPVLIAAVVIVALMGTVLAAASRFDLVEIFSSEERALASENGEENDVLYWVTPNGMTCFPVEDLPQAVRDAAARSGRPWAYLQFDDWNAASDFVGLGLLSNTVLEEFGKPLRTSTTLSRMSCEGCAVELVGSEPSTIYLTAAYLLDEDTLTIVTLEATAYTDALGSDREPAKYGLGGDGVDSAEAEEYVTANGVETIIMTNDWSGELHTVMGYFTQNGIHYCLRVNDIDSDRCVQTMKEVLDGFQ